MSKKYLFSILMIPAVMSVAILGGVAAEDGDATRLPFLGIRFEEHDMGVLVTLVAPDSPAEEATLQTGDIITAVDEVSVTADSITETVQSYLPDDTIQLSVMRDEETLEIEAVLGSIPAPLQGFQAFSLNPILGVQLDETDSGLVIAEIAPQSPAEIAGLQADDIILTINEQEITTIDDAQSILQEQSFGDTLTIEVQRDEETLTFEATMDVPFFGGRNPESMPFPPNFEFRGEGRSPFGFEQQYRPILLGVRFATLGTQASEAYEVDLAEGAYIVEVMSETPAELIGLQVGDVIVAVDGDVVDVERTLSDRLFAYEVGDTVVLDVWRDGETLQFDVTLGPIVESADLSETT